MVVLGRVHRWTWVWQVVVQGGHGGLGGSLSWVTYLGRTAGLVEDLDVVAGGGGLSGCLGGGRSFAGLLGSICTSDVCVCASSVGWAKVSPSFGWSWWSWVGA